MNHSPNAQGRDLPFFFPQEVVSITHEQNIIYWQLFAGHVVGSRPMKTKIKTL